MALKNLKNIVTDLGSKYQGANQGPACCGSKASWENVFGGGGISPDPPPGCCADLGENYPSFGLTIGGIEDPRIQSTDWTCPPIDCRLTLSFFPTGYNLENDPAATISVVINGTPYQLNWGQWNDWTINSGDQISIQFNHTLGICNQAAVVVNNVTCSTNYGNVANIYFGDPACIFCPQWDMASIFVEETTAHTPIYINTTTQTQHIQVTGGVLIPGSGFGESWIEINGSIFAYLTQGGFTLGVVDVYLSPGDQMVIVVQSADGKCYDVEVQIENVSCGYSVGMINEIQVNSLGC